MVFYLKLQSNNCSTNLYDQNQKSEFINNNFVHIYEDSTIDKVGGNIKVVRVKIEVKIAKFKSKNLIKPFLAKSQLFAKSFRSDFLIPKARLAFTKLKQAFIKALILYHFDWKYYICIKTDISKYVIGKVLSQLTLKDLG